MKASRRPAGALLRAGGLLLLLLASLSVVVWRQTRGVALQREIRALQAERAIAESERLRLSTRIQSLQSRARIVRVARERLEMRLPADSQVVLLPLPPEEAVAQLAEVGR